MRPLQMLIKPASANCNLNCRYCFYCDEAQNRETASYGMMSEETLRRLVKKVMFQAEGEVCFAFQGGEPTLRGIDFFRKAVELEERFNRNHVRVPNTLQTNASDLDDEWCRLVRDYGFQIGYMTGTGVAPAEERLMRGSADPSACWKNTEWSTIFLL